MFVSKNKVAGQLCVKWEVVLYHDDSTTVVGVILNCQSDSIWIILLSLLSLLITISLLLLVLQCIETAFGLQKPQLWKFIVMIHQTVGISFV